MVIILLDKREQPIQQTGEYKMRRLPWSMVIEKSNNQEPIQSEPKLAFFINLQRAVNGPSATLTGDGPLTAR